VNEIHRPKIRIAAATAGALLVALLAVTGASAKGPKPPKPPKPHGPGTHVPCAGQAALVAAINAANTAGGGKITLAPHCDYQLTTADNGENGLPVITTKITIEGRHATIEGTGSVHHDEDHDRRPPRDHRRNGFCSRL
jgi:hypothetical protein